MERSSEINEEIKDVDGFVLGEDEASSLHQSLDDGKDQKQGDDDVRQRMGEEGVSGESSGEASQMGDVDQRREDVTVDADMECSSSTRANESEELATGQVDPGVMSDNKAAEDAEALEEIPQQQDPPIQEDAEAEDTPGEVDQGAAPEQSPADQGMEDEGKTEEPVKEPELAADLQSDNPGDAMNEESSSQHKDEEQLKQPELAANLKNDNVADDTNEELSSQHNNEEQLKGPELASVLKNDNAGDATNEESSSQYKDGEPFDSVTDALGDEGEDDGLENPNMDNQDLHRDGDLAESSAMLEGTEEGGEGGWCEDGSNDAPVDAEKQPLEKPLGESSGSVESAQTEDIAPDTEMDTTEEVPKQISYDGDKEIVAEQAMPVTQMAGGDALGVGNVRGSEDKANDGGDEVMDVDEEDESILDQHKSGDADGDKIGEKEMDNGEAPLTTQEEDALLMDNAQSKPPSQTDEQQPIQDSNLPMEEPMDTSEGGEGIETGEGDVEAPAKETDDGEDRDAMETDEQVDPGADSIGQEQGPSTDTPAHTGTAVSGAEALVRGESQSESSVHIKKEILTEVMTEVKTKTENTEGAEDPAPQANSASDPLEKDVDVKPSKVELDRILNEAQAKETAGNTESAPSQATEETESAPQQTTCETEGAALQAGRDKEGTPSQAKAAEGKKNNKGSSITSIVGRLFNKKEQEARAKKEMSPEEPADEIANVPFKISGVKSLAAPNQAARQQQRQELRQSSSSPLLITNVTSLAEAEKCSKCSKQIPSIDSAYKWQKEFFCSFSCLDTTRITSTKTVTCDSCTVVLHPRIRNVHFAKVGKEMREFCSTRCSKNSEESPKLCPGCGKDVSASSNPVLAQTGSEGIFFEFCTQDCVNKYEERILGDANKGHEISLMKQVVSQCSECENSTVIRYEFIFHQVKKLFCSEACFDSFRMKYNTKIDRCATCNGMCYNDISAGLVWKNANKTYNFCNEKCKDSFKWPCSFCSKKHPATKMDTIVEGTQRLYFCKSTCKDSYSKKFGPSRSSSIYECLTGTSSVTAPSAGLPPIPPLSTIHHLPADTGGVPQSISSNQVQVQTTQIQQASQVPQQPQQVSSTGPQATKCDHCHKVQRPLYHLTMSDRTLRDFCSYNCVISFQSQFNVPPVTLPEETLLLRCHKCQRGFNSRPFVLDYEDKTSLFCSELCLEDYKRTNCVFVRCDQCHQEKILFERSHFSGESRNFCSQGCMLLFKQEIVQTLGLQCIVCDYCAQMCKQDISEVVGGIKRHFCRTECKSKYELWFYKVARCDGCKNTGRELREKFSWRGEVKHVCNQQCLLLFYTQQNIPNVTTQLPEDIPTSTAEHATPTIAKVMSLAPMERLSAPRTIVKENKKTFTNKQTQITTNTVYIKPPPPPPSELPPPPKMVRNKITSCRPIQITKATMCRPIMKEMGVGTDFAKVPAMVPIPFPVFVPVPMQMYTSHIPHPVAIPVPVPTPMFIPVAARDCDQLLKTMQEIKDLVPTDPLQAELFMMAAAAADDEDTGSVGTEKEGSSKRGSISEKEGNIRSLEHRSRASLVDQAMVECGLIDEPIDEMGVDELLASLSSPDGCDDILLMDEDLEDEADKEKKELLKELSHGLNVLGHIPESAANPPPPVPLMKKVKRITVKKKAKKRKRTTTRRKKASVPSPAPPPPVDTGSGLRRSSRSAKRTKYYTDEDSQDDDPGLDEDEYEPETRAVSSSSEEEIVEMVDELVDPQPAPAAPSLPPTDDAWVTAGLLAYKLFVLGLDEESKPLAQKIKPEVLECSPDTIHRGLIRFIREARQPDGEPYPPETLLLMCLSIQRHLTDNGRLDNFLAGPNFDLFRDCLHKALAPWEPRLHPTTGLLLNSRINEEMMWASQQLGAHSPHVLLSTIFYFNCRNLRMRSAEEHSKLAFFRMQKLVKKASTPSGKVCLLRYFPPKKKQDEKEKEKEKEKPKKGGVSIGTTAKKKEFDPETLDQNENTENPLRCPVKLYEFYLSKCPESIKMRNEIFYLLPEHSCIPDSPVWYSATKLPDDEMEKMLRRYGMIQEVQAGWQQKMKEEEKEREEEERQKEAERLAALERGEGDGEGEGGGEDAGEGSSLTTE